MARLTPLQSQTIADEIVDKVSQMFSPAPDLGGSKKNQLQAALETALGTADFANVNAVLSSDEFILYAAGSLVENGVVHRKEGRKNHVSVNTANLQSNVNQSLSEALQESSREEETQCDQIMDFVFAVLPAGQAQDFKRAFEQELQTEKALGNEVRRPRDIYKAAFKTVNEAFLKELNDQLDTYPTQKDGIKSVRVGGKDLGLDEQAKESFSSITRSVESYLTAPDITLQPDVYGADVLSEACGGILKLYDSSAGTAKGSQSARNYSKEDTQEILDTIAQDRARVATYYTTHYPVQAAAYQPDVETYTKVQYDKEITDFQGALSALHDNGRSIAEQEALLTHLDDIMHPERITKLPYANWDPYTQIQYITEEKVKELGAGTADGKLIEEIGGKIARLERKALRTTD